MHPIVNIAVKAARSAGKFIVRAQDDLKNLQIIKKAHNDYVTKVDQTAEAMIIDHIKKAYPEHAILGEESGLQGPEDAEALWIIDPLDGTTNFLHNCPHFCISIGVQYQGVLEHGVIYDPLRDELFCATRGHGAQLNDRKIRVSQIDRLENALMSTSFPYSRFDNLPEYLKFFNALIPKCGGIRSGGSAALDLAYVAAGRLDAFWHFDLKKWDMAAGALILQEAGGWNTTLNGSPEFMEKGNVISANPKIHQQLLSLFEQAQQ